MQRAERTASRHQGVLDHAHAVAAGMSDAQIHRAVASGRWRRVAIGVYVVAGAPATARQRTMVAYLASRQAGGVVSHLSAAAEWGLLPPPRTAHVTVPPGSSARLKVARVHRSVVAPIDRAHRGGLLVTSVSRTIIDVAAVRGQAVVAAVVDAAFCRRQATAASVVAALDRIPRGRAGKALAREVIDVWTPRIEPGSPAEIRLLRAAAVEGIVDLVPQYEVFDDAGGFVARLDLAQTEAAARVRVRRRRVAQPPAVGARRNPLLEVARRGVVDRAHHEARPPARRAAPPRHRGAVGRERGRLRRVRSCVDTGDERTRFTSGAAGRGR